MKVKVVSADPQDIRVISDLMRIYFPDLSSNEENSELITNKILPQEEVILKVKKNGIPQELEAILKIKGQKYRQKEGVQNETFCEEKTNREKRLLRLAIHKLMVRVFGVEPSPWGILTGVRPTKIVHRFIDEGLMKERVILHLTRDYGISSERANLLWQVASFQHPILLNKEDVPKLVSLYLGIPFCPTRCHYCSFPAFSLKQWGHKLEDYLSGLDRELKTVGKFLTEKQVKVQSVYIGGGTPTILSERQMESLLKSLTENFRFVEDRELTVEGGRPDTLTREKLRVLKEYGVNRLSINPQSMREETLVAIGRKHSVQEIISAYELARAEGIPIINTDLIIGLPGENCSVLENTLQEVLKLGPENITLHALAMKRAAYYRQEKINLPLPAEGKAMMDFAHDILQDAGYFPYYLYRQREIFAHGENVGYSLPGRACLYNIQMMEERQTILGFGVGSGSKFVNKDDWTLENLYNPKDIIYYLERLDEIIGKKVDKLQSI
ncbi:MAG: coproporphyrinogen dehydrogenase HemZ [Clostridia bacterium]|jgi:oxygen-independent coproporphyrinogen-3 oxidase|nr:coproporphyrinogen dehydrogenase HemZ [Clostridia bacterium]